MLLVKELWKHEPKLHDLNPKSLQRFLEQNTWNFTLSTDQEALLTVTLIDSNQNGIPKGFSENHRVTYDLFPLIHISEQNGQIISFTGTVAW